ncbi:MAG: ParB N-terminal domain-containing protein [Pseudomonadota bacterium]
MQSIDDLDRVQFEDGVAALEVSVELLAHIKFKNDTRGESARLSAVERSIRDRGYDPTDPIIARVGQKGRWIIVDGGHRLTAARHVANEFWSNLLSRKVRMLYFLLFETERSWRKIGKPGERTPPKGNWRAVKKAKAEPKPKPSRKRQAAEVGSHGAAARRTP